jgi:protein KRI1
VEEKYGKSSVRFQEASDDDVSGSSSDEDEDDEGEFATTELDAEINDALNAIRSRDPRVYDESAKFYKEFEAPVDGDVTPKAKSMTLKDYHRENLLAAARGDTTNKAPKTYVQEQADVKHDLVRALHDAAEEAEESDTEDDDFLKAKERSAASAGSVVLPDPKTADKDPENFLSNFFAARAWVPSGDSRFAHLESDNEEEDQRAEEFEQAYNLRFEDPEVSNQKLISHSREAVNDFSVRREEKSSRKKAREREQEKKEAEKTERGEEKARLRKLKVEQMEDKIDMIRKAAGGRDVNITDWANVLEEDWDDSRFNEEMRQRFGDDYYEESEGGSSSDEEDMTKTGKKRKPKKPTWDDDIDIKDLVPDFVEDDDKVSLSDDDAQRTTKFIKQQKADKKASSRRDRRIIESLVDQSLVLTSNLPQGKDEGPRFSYRETSPSNFGLTALDILAADDAQLNQWAGIKKLAAFRDPSKKDKDKKRLSKKGRLREWRKETFGSKEGPGLKDWYVEGAEVPKEAADDGVDIKEGKRKRKRGKKKATVDA